MQGIKELLSKDISGTKMNTQRKALAAFALLALSASPTLATVITEKRHVIVDPTNSSATSTTTELVNLPNGGLEAVTTTKSTRIAGEFDLVLTTYIWENENPISWEIEDPTSSGLPNFIPIYPQETWVSFTNINLQLVDEIIDIDLLLMAELEGDIFSNDGHPCSYPKPPSTLCTGFISGEPTTLTGILTDQTLKMSVVQPNNLALPPSGITFTINGMFATAGNTQNAVPLPSTLLLITTALLGLRRFKT